MAKRSNWKRIKRLATWSALLYVTAIASFLYSAFVLRIPSAGESPRDAELINSIRGILINLTSSLIAAATSVALYRLFLMSDEEEHLEIERRLRAIEQSRVREFHGIEACLPEISLDHLKKELDFGDVYIVNTFINNGVLGGIIDALQTKILKGNSVRVALIHPDSKVVAARAAGSRFGRVAIQEYIRENIEEFRLLYNTKLGSDARPRLKVYFYDKLPMAAYLFPSRVQVTYFLFNSGTSSSPQIVYNLNMDVGRKLADNVIAYFPSVDSQWEIQLNRSYNSERNRTKALLI